MADENSRATRVGERIRAELMEMLLRGAVKDPGVRGAVVHEVRVTGDLRQARVYVRLSEPDPEARRQAALMKGLGRAAGFLRREVGARLGIRHSPELSFHWDDTTDRARRMESLLAEIRAEEPVATGAEDASSEGADEDSE